MSSKLAKVLLICALAVALPLFIAGTVIAVYYSMDAVTTFEIYTNEPSVEDPTLTSRANIEYNEETHSYTVRNGHSKNTNVEFESAGFNLDYWFDGTYDEYIQLLARVDGAEEGAEAELEEKKISESDILSFQTGDYENITAVFSVVTFDVNFNIVTDPDTNETTSGSTTVRYGEDLSSAFGTNLSNTNTHDFLGYAINGDNTIYTTATFPTPAEGESLTIVAVWEEIPSFQINYIKEGSTVATSEEFNRNNYASINVALSTDYNTNGYTAIWQYNGAEFTGVTEEVVANPSYDVPVNLINVTLVETPIDYMVSVSGSASGISAPTYNRTETFSVNAENYSAFAPVAVVSNWTFEQYSWTFGGFRFNNSNYGTTSELIKAITARHPDGTSGTIYVTVTFDRDPQQYSIAFWDSDTGTRIGTTTVLDTASSVSLPTAVRRTGYRITEAELGTTGIHLGVTTYTHSYSNGNVTTSGGSLDIVTDLFDGNTLAKVVYLTYDEMSYNVSYNNNSGSATITDVNIENYTSKLSPLFQTSNWVKYSNLETFNGVKIGSTTFTSAQALFNYLLGNRGSGATVTTTGDIDYTIKSVVVDGITYVGDIRLQGGSVIAPNKSKITIDVADFDADVLSAEGLFAYDLTQTLVDSSNTVVKPSSVGFSTGADGRDVELYFTSLEESGDYSIFNFLNDNYSNLESCINNGVLTLNDIMVKFEKVA